MNMRHHEEEGGDRDPVRRDLLDADLLKPREAARLLSVSRWTIYRWVKEGEIDAVKIGKGSLRIYRRSLLKLIHK